MVEFEDTLIAEIREYDGIKVLFYSGFGYDENQEEEVHFISLKACINGIEAEKKFYAKPEYEELEFWSEFNSVCGEGETIIDCCALELIGMLKGFLSK